MHRKVIVVLLFGVFSFLVLSPGFGETPFKEYSDSRIYQTARTTLDYISDTMDSLQIKYQYAGVSPLIRSETWYEYPVEIGCLLSQEQLIPLLKKFSSFSFNGIRIRIRSLAISTSAECDAKGNPILPLTLNLWVYFGDNIEHFFPPNLNEKHIRYLTHFFQLTTFTPQVEKKVILKKLENSGEPIVRTKIWGMDNWITNLRIDSDQRVQMTGYTLGPKIHTKLGSDLLKTGTVEEVSLTNMNRNTYEKVPVWRYDMTYRLPMKKK